MILEEIQNNITKKIKYSSKTIKKTKNNIKQSTKNTKNINFSNTSNPINNITPNTTPNNNNNNTLISPVKLTKLAQTITSQNTIQHLHKKITLIINEAVASSIN